MNQSVLIVTVFIFLVGLVSSAILPVDNQLPLHREKRQKEPTPNFVATGKQQHGSIMHKNPDGSGGRLIYGHGNGGGHVVGGDVRVPVWSNGQSSLSLGGGATQKLGGPGGNQDLDKRVSAVFSSRW